MKHTHHSRRWLLSSLLATLVVGTLGVCGAAQPAAPAKAVRIALVSDTHMGKPGVETTPLYRARFEKAIAAVNEAKVDLVVVAGDITEDGTEGEFKMFTELAKGFKAPMCVVPGNHDIGNKVFPGKSNGPDAERLALFEKLVGPSSFVKTIAGVRVIGVASPLFGSGQPAEASLWKMLEKELAAPKPGLALLLTHYPPYTDKADEPAVPYWNINNEPRARLIGLLERGGIRNILGGHLHKPLELRDAKFNICVTPPVAFGLPKGKQPQAWTLVTIGADGGLTREVRLIVD